MSIDCTGLTEAQVLTSLVNYAKPQGMGRYASSGGSMTEAQAEEMLQHTKDFDYIDGKPIKIDFSTYPQLNCWLYDRDSGQGAAQRLVNELKAKAASSAK